MFRRFHILVLLTGAFAFAQEVSSEKSKQVSIEKDTLSIISDTLSVKKEAISKQGDIPKSELKNLGINLIQERDSLSKRLLFGNDTIKKKIEFTYKDYRIINYDRDTTYIDSSLTIQKFYKYNLLRRDDFELMPFPNMGQTYTRLGRDFRKPSLFPLFGATAKHFDYATKEDIRYYSTASPASELFFKKGIDQGQGASGFISVNPSPEFNIAFDYKGSRSLGKYRSIRAVIDKAKISINYHTKNKRWHSRFHYANQTYENQENGGISNLTEFEGKDPSFDNRSQININYEDTNSKLYGVRYFFDNEVYIYKKDSLGGGSDISIGHEYTYHIKNYIFSQKKATPIYGIAFRTDDLSDLTQFRMHEHHLYGTFSKKNFGKLRLDVIRYHWLYYFTKAYYKAEGFIPHIISDKHLTSFSAKYRRAMGKMHLYGSLGSTIKGKYDNNYMRAGVNYHFAEDMFIGFEFGRSTKTPDLNKLLYHSEYVDYSWINTEKFKKEDASDYTIRLRLRNALDFSMTRTTLKNHTYFTTIAPMGYDNFSFVEQDLATKSLVLLSPYQTDKPISYLKIRISSEWKAWKFALNNTLLYQEVKQSKGILNLPKWVTRNTFYFHSDVFNKAMYFQAGINLKYFTGYHADDYNPLMGEYYVQTHRKIGDFPLLDFFVSGRIRQTRVFIILEHFNTTFSNPYYSAPYTPYHDFAFRFGLVWDFFM